MNASSESSAITVTKEMTASRAEFFRCLQNAAAPDPYRVDGDQIEIGDGGQRIEVKLTDGPTRRIGLLSLPVLCVRITLIGFDADQITERLASFDRAFQRGGG